MSCGPWSRGKIPWGDFDYPKKYWLAPDIEMPDTPEVSMADLFDTVKKTTYEPDVFISASDNYFVTGKCPVKHILIGTDPHVIDYEKHLRDVFVYVSMQKFYSQGHYWMPYGYDPTIHQDLHLKKRDYDVVFCGLQYDHRKEVLEAVEAKGHRVFNSLGLIYDEYVDIYNRGAIAFNWSSRNDLPARVWEGMAMGRCVVSNIVSDMEEVGMVNGKHYVGFTSKDEAVSLIDFYIGHPEKRMSIAKAGHEWVSEHTYKNHVSQMLKAVL